MKCKYLSFILLVMVVFSSCVASKNIIKTGSLGGVVVDENNKPVSDFVVYCYKTKGYKISAVTNESGIFVFPDIDAGTYSIEGYKNNYTKIKIIDYNFVNCSKLLCMQVKSLGNCIKDINSFIKVNEFHKGVKLLNSIYVKKGSLNESVLFSYQAYLNYMIGNVDVYTDCIDKLKKVENDKCKLFIKKWETFIYEK